MVGWINFLLGRVVQLLACYYLQLLQLHAIHFTMMLSHHTLQGMCKYYNQTCGAGNVALSHQISLLGFSRYLSMHLTEPGPTLDLVHHIASWRLQLEDYLGFHSWQSTDAGWKPLFTALYCRTSSSTSVWQFFFCFLPTGCGFSLSQAWVHWHS